MLFSLSQIIVHDALACSNLFITGRLLYPNVAIVTTFPPREAVALTSCFCDPLLAESRGNESEPAPPCCDAVKFQWPATTGVPHQLTIRKSCQPPKAPSRPTVKAMCHDKSTSCHVAPLSYCLCVQGLRKRPSYFLSLRVSGDMKFVLEN